MLPGMEMLGCQIDVPASVMKHVVKIESSFNPFAIGVVKGRLARQPRNLKEAVATAEMLEANGFNFSLGLAQVNRYNLKKYGIHTYADAFEPVSYTHLDVYKRQDEITASVTCSVRPSLQSKSCAPGSNSPQMLSMLSCVRSVTPSACVTIFRFGWERASSRLSMPLATNSSTWL